MSLKNLDQISEASLNNYETALNFMQNREYKLAAEYFEKAISLNTQNAMLHHKCAEAYFLLKDYKQAQELNLKSIELSTISSEKLSPELNNITINESDFLTNAYWLALKLDEILSSSNKLFDTFEVLKKLLEKSQTPRKDEIVKDMNRISQIYQAKSSCRSKIIDIRKNEAKTVFDLIEIANENRLLAEEGLPCYIISMRWFNKWKKYSFFHILSGEKMEQNEGTEIDDGLDFGDDASGGEATPSKPNNKTFPGPIDVSDLLQNEKILMDPDIMRNYCNYMLKSGLEENKDFIIVSHNVFKYLHKIYGGQDLKRHVVFINDESNLTHIEIWLKKINIIHIPPFEKKELIIETVCLSRKETIKELKEKIYRIFAETHKLDEKFKDSKNCKIWKLDQKYSLSMIQDFVKKNNKVELVNCKKLEDKLSLEDCELSENDIVLSEYKVGEDWIFTSQKEIKQNEAFQCAFCHSIKKNLSFCSCLQVKYCDMECLRKHRTVHKNFCQLKEQTDGSFISTARNPNISIKFNKNQNRGLTGLQNLGNTCFMNSSLQCLSNSYELTYYFISDSYLPDINKKNPLGSKGYLANAFSELVKALWQGTENYVSPWSLKKIIGKLAPQFSGYNQQDSQELLSYLLDGLHEDLNRIKKKPIVQSLDYKNQPDEDFSSQSWSNYLKRNHSIIIDLFAGQYKSKVTCPTCKVISITFDPFLYVSLPIPHIINISFQFYFVYRDPMVPPQKVRMTLPSNEPATSFVRRISEITKIKEDFLLIALIKEHKIVEYPNDNVDIRYLDKHEAIAFVFEIFNEKFDFPLNLDEKALHVEINVNQKSKKEKYYDNSVSFTRILKFPLKSTLFDVHLKVYKNFRHFLKNFYGNLDAEVQNDYNISLEDVDEEHIKAEYETLFSKSKSLSPPYELSLLTENNKKLLLEYSQKQLMNLVDNNQTDRELFFEINLNMQSFIKIENLKLNKCQEASFESNTPNDSKFCNLQNCLDQFIKEEVLDRNNAWYCGNCKKHQEATKKIEIYKAPDLLILHLKRFKNSSGNFYMSSGTSKITKFVDFPIEGLNLNNYVLGKKDQNMIYDLYAVSNHYGGLSGGHYTAYCQNFFDKNWFEFNDSSVGEVGKSRIVSDAAYVLFYRRRREISEENLSNSFRENRKVE